MEIDNKMIMDLAEQMGLSEQKNSNSFNSAAKRAEQYKNKSDDELVREILKLKQLMKKDRVAYEKQIATLKALGGMMKGEQRTRLLKIIELLEN